MLIGRGVAEGLLDGALGDLVEGDAADPVVGELERLLEVPGDGLALAVGVGRQVDQCRPAPRRASARRSCPSWSGRPRRTGRSRGRRPARASAWGGRARAPCWPSPRIPPPRNLSIDLAFFGLSTITKDGPLPLADGSAFSAALRRAGAFLAEAALAAPRFFTGDSACAHRPGRSAILDLLATVRSHLSCWQLAACVDHRLPSTARPGDV